MKKTIICAFFIGASMMLTSCYNVTTCVNMGMDEPAVMVNTVHNNHFVYGLVGHQKIDAKQYTTDTRYKIKNYQSFVDGLLSTITFGIYTPSTTEFYQPVK
ncbi:MAG: Bor protein [Prevotella sp.]|nr:Bor protein [Prevotella sp.]